jgi:Peptidase propeptide and YPEB domain
LALNVTEGVLMTVNRKTDKPWLGAASTLAAFVVLLGLDGGAAAQSGRAPARVSEEQATQAALKTLPGKVTDVTVEKKRGKSVYVVEIVSDKDGAETDVLVDLESGLVLGIDK